VIESNIIENCLHSQVKVVVGFVNLAFVVILISRLALIELEGNTVVAAVNEVLVGEEGN
jgi:hypothetical protein